MDTQRSPPSFANINFIGKCNLNCFFCIGKDLCGQVGGIDTLHTPVDKLKNLDKYLDLCKASDIKNIYLTGQNADPLLYDYLGDIIDKLQADGFSVGIRTNGLLVPQKINEINGCKKSISYSMLSRAPLTMKRMTGVARIPDFDWIFTRVKIPQRVATVVTRFNSNEILDLIQYTSRFPQIRYFQVRQVCTEWRTAQLSAEMAEFDRLLERVNYRYPKIGNFENAPIYEISGMKTVFWKTVETSVNSFNYFTDGTISPSYFVVRGYLENR